MKYLLLILLSLLLVGCNTSLKNGDQELASGEPVIQRAGRHNMDWSRLVTVYALLEIDEKGKAKLIRITDGADSDDERVIKFVQSKVRELRYTPPMENGVAVKKQYIQPFMVDESLL